MYLFASLFVSENEIITAMENKQIWYAHSGKKYLENEPCFFNTANSAWAVDIEKNWQELKGEIKALINEKDKNFEGVSYLGLTNNNGWSALSYLFWGSRVKEASLKDSCPKLSGYLNKMPGIVSVSFSRLAPNTIINEHRGDCNAVLRCHIGIEVPIGLPECGIRVGNEERSWEEGKWLFFNDAWKHSAWNKTDKRRIVLIIDVIRPEFLNKKRAICANIRTVHILLNIAEKYKISSPLMKRALFMALYIPVYMIKLIRPSTLK